MDYDPSGERVHTEFMTNWVEKAGAYWFALWHLQRAPLADATAQERACWCRDHCGAFAARWFALGAGLWLIFSTPFVSSAPIAFVGLFGLAMGMWHITWQIMAQKKAGPPKIDEPVEFPHDESGDDEQSRRRD